MTALVHPEPNPTILGGRSGVRRQGRRPDRADAPERAPHGEEPEHRGAVLEEAGPPGVAQRVLDERLDELPRDRGWVPGAVAAQCALDVCLSSP